MSNNYTAALWRFGRNHLGAWNGLIYTADGTALSCRSAIKKYGLETTKNIITSVIEDANSHIDSMARKDIDFQIAMAKQIKDNNTSILSKAKEKPARKKATK